MDHEREASNEQIDGSGWRVSLKQY